MLNPGDPWPSWDDVTDWRVWRCREDSSECEAAYNSTLMAFPSTESGARVCPDCGKLSLWDIGYSVQEFRDLETTLATDMDLVLPHPPPFELVPLLNIPQRMWMGLTVFVSPSQSGGGANWWSYDVGAIMEVWLEGGDARVRFLHSLGGSPVGTLNYAAMFCWVPKPLADRLTMSDVEKLAEVGHD